jgi:hypothetical protein
VSDGKKGPLPRRSVGAHKRRDDGDGAPDTLAWDDQQNGDGALTNLLRELVRA